MRKILIFIAYALTILTFFQIEVDAYSITENSQYPVFCQSAAENDEVFASFKRNDDYTPVLEHVSENFGAKYLDIIKFEYPELLQYFSKFAENDYYGSPTVYDYGEVGVFSPTTLRYIKVAGDLKKMFGEQLSKMHIVEIGGGYGGQCKILSDLTGFASYTLIDLPSCNLLSSKYLGLLNVQNVFFINCHQLTGLDNYDLVISNYAFSEIDLKTQTEYFEKIIKKAPHGYMTMNYLEPLQEEYQFERFDIKLLKRKFSNINVNLHISLERPLTQPPGFAPNVIVSWGAMH